jgi:hypothetical protein
MEVCGQEGSLRCNGWLTTQVSVAFSFVVIPRTLR